MKRRNLNLWWMGLVILVACGGDRAPIVVEDAWARPAPASAQTGAFYLTLENNTEGSLTLTGVQADICQATDFHETAIDEAGVMSMRPVAGGALVIPAEATLNFEPGGLHIMCMGLNGPLEAGESVPLSLTLEGMDNVNVEAEILEEPP